MTKADRAATPDATVWHELKDRINIESGVIDTGEAEFTPQELLSLAVSFPTTHTLMYNEKKISTKACKDALAGFLRWQSAALQPALTTTQLTIAERMMSLKLGDFYLGFCLPLDIPFYEVLPIYERLKPCRRLIRTTFTSVGDTILAQYEKPTRFERLQIHKDYMAFAYQLDAYLALCRPPFEVRIERWFMKKMDIYLASLSIPSLRY